MSWGETLFLKKIITSQRKYAASDSVLTVLTSSRVSIENEGTENLSSYFVPKTDGSVRIEVDLQPFSPTGLKKDRGGYFRILKDGAVIADSGFVYQFYDDINQQTVYRNNGIRYFDIPIVKNSKYTFQLYSPQNYGGISASNIKICGQVVDLSMLDYVTQ